MNNPFAETVQGIRSGLMSEPGVVDKIFEKNIEIVHEDPNNPRSESNAGYTDEALQDLADDIRDNGIINAIVVREHPTLAGEYQIVSGHRRYRAAKIAGLTKIPVRISRTDNFREEQISENLHRENLTIQEMASIIKEYADQGMTTRDIAKKLHKSQSFVAQHLQYLKLPQEILDLYASGTIVSLLHGIDLAKALKESPEVTRAAIEDWKNSGKEVSMADVRELRKSIKAEHDREEEIAKKYEAKEPVDDVILPSRTKGTVIDRMRRRFIEITVEYKGEPAMMSLDRLPNEGKVWITRDKIDYWEVPCSAIKLLSVTDVRFK